MKRNLCIALFGIILCIFVMSCGGGGKYADVIKLNEQFAAAMEDYISEIDQVKNAQDAADAMNRLSDKMEKLAPKIRKAYDSYPELKDKDNMPAEIEASNKKARAAGEEMGATFMKLMPYMEDPEVVKAQERLSKVMRDL